MVIRDRCSTLKEQRDKQFQIAPFLFYKLKIIILYFTQLNLKKLFLILLLIPLVSFSQTIKKDYKNVPISTFQGTKFPFKGHLTCKTNDPNEKFEVISFEVFIKGYPKFHIKGNVLNNTKLNSITSNAKNKGKLIFFINIKAKNINTKLITNASPVVIQN